MTGPVEGSAVSGRYVLRRIIGAGGMGTVWEAYDHLLDRTVAVKQIVVAGNLRDEQRAEIMRLAAVEARSAARLNHPSIVAIHDVVAHDGVPWIVMQHVPGGSLEQLVIAHGPLPLAVVARIAADLLNALDAAHGAGIIHRDVKPSNILIDESDKALLTDFSIARAIGSGSVTNTGIILGSPGYIAPERVVGGEITPALDLFGLGATLFYASEGVGPFDGDDSMAATFATAVRPHPRPQLAGVLTPLIDGLLVKDPRERMTAAQARALLAEVMPSLPAPGDYRAKRAPRKIKARRSMTTEVATAPLFAALPPSPGTSPVPFSHANPGDPGAAPPSRRRVLRPLLITAGTLVLALVLAGIAHGAVGIGSPAPHLSLAPAGGASFPVGGPPSPSPAISLDTIAPGPPTYVRLAGRTTTAITLIWDPSTDDVGVTGYVITRDGTKIGAVATPGYTDRGLTPSSTHRYTVYAQDAAGNISSLSPVVTAATLAAPDRTAPAAPTDLRWAGRSPTTITLAWNAARDNVGVTAYEVFRGGRRVATVTGLGYTDTGLLGATTYAYVIRALDAAGNVSAPGGLVTITTSTAPDTTAPSTPTDLRADEVALTSATIEWDDATDNASGISGYQVFRGTTLLITTSATDFSDTGLYAGTSYTYKVKAVDGSGNVSGAASVTIKTSPAAVTSVSLVSAVTGAPACTATIVATVHVNAAPITVNLTYHINGSTGLKAISFTGRAAQSSQVTLGTGAGTADGVASASAGSVTGNTSWSAPLSCTPAFIISAPAATPGPMCTKVSGKQQAAILGSIHITAYKYPSPETFTVHMYVGAASSGTASTIIAPNSAATKGVTSTGTYPSGTYSVRFVVSEGAVSHTSGSVNVTVNCT